METHAYKTRLEEMLKDIVEELKTVGINNPENREDWIAIPENLDGKEADLNDAADNIEEWNERRALVATLETRYNNIRNALTRIEDGSYGKCEICQNEIEANRLDANPAAATCIAHLEEALEK